MGMVRVCPGYMSSGGFAGLFGLAGIFRVFICAVIPWGVGQGVSNVPGWYCTGGGRVLVAMWCAKGVAAVPSASSTSCAVPQLVTRIVFLLV